MNTHSSRRSAWFHVDMDGLDAIFQAHGRTWRGGTAFYESAVDRSLEFFDAHGAKATYFVIARDVDVPEKRAALERIIAGGHRIACHSMGHRILNRIESAEELRVEIVDAKAKLEQKLGVPCVGYRAPGYSIDYPSLELLCDAGYLYDSSAFPTYAFRRQLEMERLPGDPFEPFPGANFFEIPLPRPTALGPIHACYAFYLGVGHFSRGLRAHMRRSNYLTLLFHLTDFAERQSLGAGPKMTLFACNLRSAAGKRRFLDRLMKPVAENFRFTTTEEFLERWPGSAPDLNPRTILGVSTTHETGACIVRDGRLVSAITEERLSRRKLDTAYPPEGSIREAIRIAGVKPEEIDAVAIAGLEPRDLLPQMMEGVRRDVFDFHALNDYFPHAARLLYRLFYFRRAMGYRSVQDFLERTYGIRPKLHFIEHHEAHAASAYRTGEAEEALIVTADGVGDDVCMSVSMGSRGAIRRLETIFYPHSLGQFYTACTQVLGFKGGRHEGKITGLAGFGKPNPELLAKLEKTILVEDGGFRLHKKYYVEGFVRFTPGQLLRLPFKGVDTLSIDYRNFKPPLRRMLRGYTREEVAYAFQHLLERETVRLTRRFLPDGPLHLALAGGVFANVKLNMALSQELRPESIYVFPAMGDGGLCVGAALTLAGAPPAPLKDVYLGTGYDDDGIDAAIEAHPELEVTRPDELERGIAALLADETIVARFDGRMEFGPRALGNRSILYHCADPSVNAWLNKQLRRTEFMPFAPICLHEDALDYFDIRPGEARTCEFMTLVVRCTDRMMETCPAAVHVDGTARPQLVRRDVNPGMHRILEHYRDITGVSCVINTSFNMHEEPIVRSPAEAITAFLQSNLHYLALGPYLVRRRQVGVREMGARSHAATSRTEAATVTVRG